MEHFPLWIAFFAALVGFVMTFAYYGSSFLKNNRAISCLVPLQSFETLGTFTTTPQPPFNRNIETAKFVAPSNAAIYFLVTFWLLFIRKLLWLAARERRVRRQVAGLEHS
jgi:hypothetical protein